MPEARLTVIGSGTLLPSAERRSSAYHLRVATRSGAAAHSVLIDCGSGALHGLAACGVDWRDIDVVAVTHYHSDHIADLASLLGAYRFEGRTRPLALLGPSDLGHFLGRLAGLYGEWILDPGFPLDVVELGPSGQWIGSGGDLRISACPTPHTDVSIALRMSGSWGELGYTGDSGPSPELARFLAGCDLLVAECALSDPPEIDTHLSPSSLSSLAADSRPGLLLVTHVYPPQRVEDAVRGVRRLWDGEVEAACDGMRVRLAPGGADVDRSPRAG
jgi:ribonuclease BN (tRNA processing enzyme)